MSHKYYNDNICNCLSECIDKTDKANTLSKSNPSFFSAKERQFFLLLSNNDCFSKKATSYLMTKVPLNHMFEAGLVKQTRSCQNFSQLLAKSDSDKVKNSVPDKTQAVNEPSPIIQLLASQ